MVSQKIPLGTFTILLSGHGRKPRVVSPLRCIQCRPCWVIGGRYHVKMNQCSVPLYCDKVLVHSHYIRLYCIAVKFYTHSSDSSVETTLVLYNVPCFVRMNCKTKFFFNFYFIPANLQTTDLFHARKLRRKGCMFYLPI